MNGRMIAGNFMVMNEFILGRQALRVIFIIT